MCKKKEFWVRVLRREVKEAVLMKNATKRNRGSARFFLRRFRGYRKIRNLLNQQHVSLRKRSCLLSCRE